mgnify:FL=1
MRAIGIDVGGTAIKFALVSDGEVLLRAQCPTPTGDPPALAKAAAALIRENAPDWEMLPIGFACAGDVDPKTGLVSADNLGWQNVPLGFLLREALGQDVLLEQDTHAAMMAEWANGSLKGEKNALYLTIGTGVGGGAILDGRPYREIRRPGSEFGHMITHAGGEPCPCGERGCYERYASSAALVRRAKGYKNAKEIVDAVQRNDPAILPIWESYIEEVCVGLVSLMAIFYPEVISIGGGISASGDFLLNAILKGLSHHEGYRKYYSHIRIRLADFGNDAGVLGAAAAACRELEKE